MKALYRHLSHTPLQSFENKVEAPVLSMRVLEIFPYISHRIAVFTLIYWYTDNFLFVSYRISLACVTFFFHTHIFHAFCEEYVECTEKNLYWIFCMACYVKLLIM